MTSKTDDLFTRNAAVCGWKPRTFDDDTQSVKVVAVTENPVQIWDWERKAFINEILVIEGVSLPESGRVPLLDSHNRASVTGVLGSARNFQKIDNTLEADVAFAETEAGRDTAVNVRDGHLTDFSVGYHPLETFYLESGETREINGRTFEGPVKVTTQWQLRELSVTAIGADKAATARSFDGGVPDEENRTPLAPAEPAPLLEDKSARAAAPETVAASSGKKPTSMVDVVFYVIVGFMILAFLRGLF